MEDNGGELVGCLEVRCRQLGGLLRERRETLCSLEADLDQVGSVVPSELEGASAVDECTPSLGGMEVPEPIVVARIPSVVTSVVQVCVFTSVANCVLQRAHCVGARACVRATASVDEAPRVSETPCVSGVVASVPKCVLPSTPGVNETPCVEEMTCE